MSPDVSLAEFYVVGYRQRRVLEVTISFKDKAIIVQKVVLSSGIQDMSQLQMFQKVEYG